MSRYFIITYLGTDPSLGFGSLELINEKGNYPSRKFILDYLRKQERGEVVIVNIQELSKKDYFSFISE